MIFKLSAEAMKTIKNYFKKDYEIDLNIGYILIDSGEIERTKAFINKNFVKDTSINNPIISSKIWSEESIHEGTFYEIYAAFKKEDDAVLFKSWWEETGKEELKVLYPFEHIVGLWVYDVVKEKMDARKNFLGGVLR